MHAEHKIHNKFSFWKHLSILFRSHLNTKWPSFIYLNSHSDAFFLSFPHRISLNPFRDPSPHPVPKITKYKDHYIFLFFFFLEGTPQLFESNLHSYWIYQQLFFHMNKSHFTTNTLSYMCSTCTVSMLVNLLTFRDRRLKVKKREKI